MNLILWFGFKYFIFVMLYDLFVLSKLFLVLRMLVFIVGLIIILVEYNNNISKEKR